MIRLLLLFINLYYYYAIQSDFLLDIDGSSLIVNHQHVCVIEYKHGIDIGGKLNCWDQYQQLEHLTPQNYIFIQISGGMYFSCGITIEQSLHCWGTKQFTRQVPGMFSQVSVSNSYACAIQLDGQIYCFGHSFLIDHIKKDNKRYIQISCGPTHCCAIDEEAIPSCWGNINNKAVSPPILSDDSSLSESVNDYEEKDEEEEEESFVARNPERPFVRMRQVSVGESYSCGIDFNDNLLCWGYHPSHSKENSKLPFPRHMKGPFKQVSIGQLGICAIIGSVDDPESSYSSNSLHCWGNTKAVMPPDTSGEWDQVLVGDGMICGVSMDSELKCWGSRIAHMPKDIIIA